MRMRLIRICGTWHGYQAPGTGYDDTPLHTVLIMLIRIQDLNIRTQILIPRFNNEYRIRIVGLDRRK